MKNMDWLDRLSIWAIVVLIISSSALISHHMGEARPEQKRQQKMPVYEAAVSGELLKRAEAARGFMEGGNMEKAEAMVGELMQKYPFDGEPHMLMGDILFRKQDLIGAIFEYKEAVDLNPDYLDKKTPLFQGKKLKKVVGEALAEMERRIDADPSDRAMKEKRKVIYYLQRRIAGSCG